MARAFADITFTHSVKMAQSYYGSREANRGFEIADDSRNLLTQKEVQFIAERDSFYQATVSESGWPYVQHRGGAIGFVKIINEQTMVYADFSGNRQYISVGNVQADERISLFFMDYTNQRRLKVWGRARVIHSADNPGLLDQLENPHYKAQIERAIVIHIEAFDWNCSKHITQRFSALEVRSVVDDLMAENKQLKQQLAIYQQRNGEQYD